MTLIQELKKDYDETAKIANELSNKLMPFYKIQSDYKENSNKRRRIEELILQALSEDKESAYKEAFEIAERNDVRYIFWETGNKLGIREIFEDDGTLHITIGEVRFCFISNQDITKTQWNKEARPIVKAFTGFGFTFNQLK